MSVRASIRNRQWYLRIHDKTFGPISTDQVLNLLNHKEIMPEDELSSDHLHGRWITVREFAALSVAARFPPRPAELNQTRPPESQQQEPRPRSSSTDHLFEILQFAKDRQTTHELQAVSLPRGIKRAAPTPIWVLAAGATTLLGLIWAGVNHFRAEDTTVTQIELRHSNSDPAAPAEPKVVAALPSPAPRSAAPPVSRPVAATPARPAPRVPPPPARPFVGFGRPIVHAPPPPAADRDRNEDRQRDEDAERDRELVRERALDRDQERVDGADAERGMQPPKIDESHDNRSPADSGRSPDDGARRDDGVVHSANADEDEANRLNNSR